MTKPMFKKKHKIVFGVLAAVFTLLMIASIVGTSIANSYDQFINAFFNVKLYVKDDSAGSGSSGADADYYKSDYTKKDENGETLYKKDKEDVWRPVYDDEAMLNASKTIAERVATEGIVLLENKKVADGSKALPINMSEGSADKKVSLLGISSVDWLYSGYGSGHVDGPNANDLKTSMTAAGFAVNDVLWKHYASSSYRRVAGQGQISNSPMNNTCNEMPWSRYGANVKNTFADYGTAIVTITRDGGEGAPWDPDLTNVINDGLPYNDVHNELPEKFRNNNYLQLTPQEKELLDNVTALRRAGTFKKVILLLNMANYIQLDLISGYTDIDAMMLVGMGGTRATEAVANVLSGRDVPSGRLTDTFVYDNWSAPAMVNFTPQQFTNIADYPEITKLEQGSEDDDSYIVRQEGIYVGYRYYETRYEDTVLGRGGASSAVGAYNSASGWKYGEEVAYPFGYGLTYGDTGRFEYSAFTADETDDSVELTVTVKNTGVLPAKEVVQVYMQKPYTEYDKTNFIEKSAVELVGFEKTALIDGGATATVTVSVDKKLMRTYDAYKERTYILEDGDYYFAVGNDAHDALNNILAKKGADATKMDAAGKAGFVHTVTVKNKGDDFKKYAVSESTGNAITNRFDEADIKLAECTGDQKITYLSRSDWEGTYPKDLYKLALTDTVAKQISYVGGGEVEDDFMVDMPTLNKVTVDPEYLELLNEGKSEDEKQDRLWAINMRELAYDDPLWNNLLDQLTFNEMCNLITMGGMSTVALDSLNLPGTVTRDGPAGLGRFFADKFGVTRQGVCYPSPCVMAATFDRALVQQLGRNFGTELMHYGINGIYAPGAGLHRTAYSGRNWEYYSEDGYLSGEILSAECAGLTGVGCITYAKHIGFNDQEGDRNGVTLWGNEQAFREVYLMAYEKSCLLNTTNGLMSAFNRIGGLWSAIHPGLFTDIVRGEWGFGGHVITDAYCNNYMSTFGEAVVAGNDLWLGAGPDGGIKKHADNAVVITAMRESCHRIMYTVIHSNAMNGMTPSPRIIKVTPGWTSLLLAIEIIMGIAAGAFIVLFVLTFVLKKSVPGAPQTESAASETDRSANAADTVAETAEKTDGVSE